jgi:hypothetical protein
MQNLISRGYLKMLINSTMVTVAVMRYIGQPYYYPEVEDLVHCIHLTHTSERTDPGHRVAHSNQSYSRHVALSGGELQEGQRSFTRVRAHVQFSTVQ